MLRNLQLLACLLVGCGFNQPLGSSYLAIAHADATDTNTMPVGCMSTGTTASITLSNVPSRFSGVAPLSVFFDAAGTTATTTTRPFHDIEYSWDFGEPAGSPVNGTKWNTGSARVSSRNSATGPVTSHVFETPGIYTVALSATDGTNTVSNNCTRIVVQNPDTIFRGTNTICIAATSLPIQGVDGCPSGANTTQQADFATAINTYALSGKRVLFKRGDTFTTTKSASITRTGPGIIGAFGTGGAPIVKMTGNDTILKLSSKSTQNINDWRVMDLDFDGMSKPRSRGISAAGGINQVTLLRLKIHDTHTGIHFSDFILDYHNSHGNFGHRMWDQVSIVDSSIFHMVGGNGGGGIGLSGNRFSMMGNIVDDSTLAEHILRIFYLNKGVISNNTLSRQATTKAIIKLHGPTWCTPKSAVNANGRCATISTGYLTGTLPLGVGGVAGGYTEQVVLSGNKLESANNTDWTVNTGPQNSSSDERLRNIIVERNWFVGGNMTQVALVVNAAEVTIRNNIFDMTGGTSHKCIQISSRGKGSTEPPPKNIFVYNNTCYSASPGSFDLVRLDETATNISVMNNLGYAPFATFPTMINGKGLKGIVQSNNSTNAQIKNTSPRWLSSTPAVPADLKLTKGSYGIDSGITTLPVFSDFFRTSRPQSGVPGVIDMGAIEGVYSN